MNAPRPGWMICVSVRFRNALRPQLGEVTEHEHAYIVAETPAAAEADALATVRADYERKYPHLELLELTVVG